MKRRSKKDKGPQMLNGIHVLIVDDDVRNTFALAGYLEYSGFEMKISTVESGAAAIEFLSRHSNTEIILMDMMMSEMDGYEAISHIKNDATTSKIPVIAVTAQAMPGDREKCIQAGASDYVSKPIDIAVLLEKMTRLLNPG